MIKFRYGHIRVFLGIYDGIQAISSRFKIKNAPPHPLKKIGVRTGLNKFERVPKNRIFPHPEPDPGLGSGFLNPPNLNSGAVRVRFRFSIGSEPNLAQVVRED